MTPLLRLSSHLAPSRLFLSTVAVALLALSGCGELERVELGDFSCYSNPCEADFGQLNLNRPDGRARVEVTNVGEGDLELTDIYIEGSSPSVTFSSQTAQAVSRGTDFEWLADSAGQRFETQGVPFVLAPGERLEIELEFNPIDREHGCPTPAQPGGTLRCGEVVVISNDINADDREIRAPILATVGDSRMAVTPRIISFPAPQLVDAGSERYASHVASFEVENLGTGNMVLQNIRANSPELLIADSSGASYPITLVGGAKREFTVTWQPTSADEFTDQITVTSDALAEGVQVILVDSEGGDAAGIEVDPCGFHFGEAPVGEASEVLFDVTNTGGAGLTWGLSLSGFTSSDLRDEFVLQNADGSTVPLGQQEILSAGNSRTLKLVYTPSEAQTIDAEMVFTSNASASFRCPISAGIPVGIAQVTPQQLYWGGVPMGGSEDRSFLVTNVGRAPLVVSEIRENADLHEEFSVSPEDAGGFTVGVGESHRVTVAFDRREDDVPAQDSATLDVVHDGEGGLSRVFLTASHGDEFLPPTCVITLSGEEPFSAGDSVTFSATDSELNAGEWTTNPYNWAMSTPSGSTAALSSDFADAVSTTFDVPGTYAVTLVAGAFVSGQNVTCELTRNVTVGE